MDNPRINIDKGTSTWQEESDKYTSEIGPATPAGQVGFGVLVLCFCAALIMLTIKLGMVLFN